MLGHCQLALGCKGVVCQVAMEVDARTTEGISAAQTLNTCARSSGCKQWCKLASASDMLGKGPCGASDLGPCTDISATVETLMMSTPLVYIDLWYVDLGIE